MHGKRGNEASIPHSLIQVTPRVRMDFSLRGQT